MRLVSSVSAVFVVTTAFASSESAPALRGEQTAAVSERGRHTHHRDGQAILRFDTFGDEQLWTDVLRMHDVISTVDPATALKVGLKVDVDALPAGVVAKLNAGQVDLTDPAVTALLLRLNAVVGVKGTVDTPGKYDPRHHAFDGTNLIPLHSPSLPIVIPPIYGLKGVGFETFTADGPIWYWNSYVGVGQMGGHGSFSDPRIGLSITQTPDLVTPKLAALREYQLSLRSPTPSRTSFGVEAARRGKHVFRGQGQCSTCHQSPNFTDVLSGPDRRVPFLHDPAEVGMDPGYAARTATGRYRTTPLRGLLQHAPYFHDGSAPDLAAVVNHYDTLFGLSLSARQKADLVEYLKSL